MSGEETFEFAAAIAGVSIGLGAALLLAVLAVVGAWRLFRGANEASMAASRAALTVEQLALQLTGLPSSTTAATEHQPTDLGLQMQTLIDEQRQLHDAARALLDRAALEGGPGSAAVDELESTINRLDTTVGQMATSLANLIRLLERQQEHR